MSNRFETIETAMAALSTPNSPDWINAFAFLAQHPDTAQLIVTTFAETLEQMGMEPTGYDPSSGEPEFSPEDVARALGIPLSGIASFSGKADDA